MDTRSRSLLPGRVRSERSKGFEERLVGLCTEICSRGLAEKERGSFFLVEQFKISLEFQLAE